MSSSILAGDGSIPLDPTLGKALALETTKDTLWEHIQKGGFWVYPILTIAFISLVIGIIKLFELNGIKRIPKDKLIAVLNAIQEGDKDTALKEARSLTGPGGDILKLQLRTSAIAASSSSSPWKKCSCASSRSSSV